MNIWDAIANGVKQGQLVSVGTASGKSGYVFNPDWFKTSEPAPSPAPASPPPAPAPAPVVQPAPPIVLPTAPTESPKPTPTAPTVPNVTYTPPPPPVVQDFKLEEQAKAQQSYLDDALTKRMERFQSLLNSLYI